MTTARNAFQVLGTTTDITTCELCGRDELRGTTVLAILDNDGNDTGERVHYGTTCGAKAAGWTVTEINRRIKDAADAKRDAEEKTIADHRNREFAAMAAWAANALGIVEHSKLRDINVIMAFHASGAYAEFRGAEDSTEIAEGDADEPAPAARIARTGDRPRKGQMRPVLAGRKLRRAEARRQARAEQRPGRPVIGHRDRAIVAAHNANLGLMTAGQYLHGIGFPEVDQYASAFGRACAKIYRRTHHAEPAIVYATANGRIRRMNGYADVADLLAGAESYKRTAAFLAAEQTTTDSRTLVNA